MIFHQVEAIYYTQKRISNGSVWREEELAELGRIPVLESWTEGVTLGVRWALPGPPVGLHGFRGWNSPGAAEHAGLPGTPASRLSGLDDSDTESLSSGPDSVWLPCIVNPLVAKPAMCESTPGI